MRWPDAAKLASCLMSSIGSMSPVGARTVRRAKQDVWRSRFFRRPRPQAPVIEPTLSRESRGRTQRALAMRWGGGGGRSVQGRWCRQVLSLLSWAWRHRACRRWAARTLVDAAMPLSYALLEHCVEHLYESRNAQARCPRSRACGCKGFECTPFIEMPGDEPFPTDGCPARPAAEGGYAWCCEVLDGVTARRPLGTLQHPSLWQLKVRRGGRLQQLRPRHGIDSAGLRSGRQVMRKPCMAPLRLAQGGRVRGWARKGEQGQPGGGRAG